MSYDTTVRRQILDYFEDFVASLATYLRLYQKELGSNFFGVGQHELSMLIYQGDDFICARLAGQWLGKRVKVWKPENLSDITTCKFSGVVKHGQKVIGSCLTKKTSVSSILGVELSLVGKSRDKRVELIFSFDGRTGQLLAAPQAICMDPNIGASPPELLESKSLPRGAFHLRPSWLMQWTSSVPASDPLEGLDPDPKLAAYGVAEGLLRIAGIRTDPPRKRFDDAKSALEAAIASLSEINERAIHKVIDSYPWILVDENEILQFNSKPRFHYKERVKLEDGTIEDQTKLVEPDFIYELHDDSILCIEIESFTKRLFTTRQETGFSTPASQTIHAAFQIENYKEIFETYGSREIREQLNCPTVTLFKYLLVVGSERQPDFNRRSWTNFQRQFRGNGVDLQNWDYYLDRLTRLAQASDFSPAGPEA